MSVLYYYVINALLSLQSFLSPNNNSPQINPNLFTLQVRLQTGLLVAAKVGDVQTLDGNAEFPGQQFQSHLTGQVLHMQGRKKENKRLFLLSANSAGGFAGLSRIQFDKFNNAVIIFN